MTFERRISLALLRWIRPLPEQREIDETTAKRGYNVQRGYTPNTAGKTCPLPAQSNSTSHMGSRCLNISWIHITYSTLIPRLLHSRPSLVTSAPGAWPNLVVHTCLGRIPNNLIGGLEYRFWRLGRRYRPRRVRPAISAECVAPTPFRPVTLIIFEKKNKKSKQMTYRRLIDAYSIRVRSSFFFLPISRKTKRLT